MRLTYMQQIDAAMASSCIAVIDDSRWSVINDHTEPVV